MESMEITENNDKNSENRSNVHGTIEIQPNSSQSNAFSTSKLAENVISMQDPVPMDCEEFTPSIEKSKPISTVDMDNMSSKTRTIAVKGDFIEVIAINDPENTNSLETTAPNKNLTAKVASNKNFTLPRITNYNAINPQRFYQLLCNVCKQEIKDKTFLLFECLNFCNEDCLKEKLKRIGKNCANCNTIVTISNLGKYCVCIGSAIRQFCQNKCLISFKTAHKICCYCQTSINGEQVIDAAMVDDQNQLIDFCTQQCMENYNKLITDKSTMIAVCTVCTNEKITRIEVEVDNVIFKLCSEPCFVAFKFANNIVTEKCTMCRKYYEQISFEYTIYSNDQQIINFCSKTCQNVYRIANRQVVACDWCNMKKYNCDMIQKHTDNEQQKIIVCSFNCLELYKLSKNSFPINFNVASSSTQSTQTSNTRATSPIPNNRANCIRQIIIRPPPIIPIRNKSTMCKPVMHTKGTTCRPHQKDEATQTDNELKSVLIPIPIPIYVPMPVVSCSAPFPMPVPFPIPIPVPIFIPTTRNSAQGILKEINNIQTRLPKDPYEAELVIMAGMVADDKTIQTDSENEIDENTNPLPVIGDDILQLALNMTEDQTVQEETYEMIDLEDALSTNIITVSQETEQHQTRTVQKTSGKRSKSKKDSKPMEVPQPNTDNIHDETDMFLKYEFGLKAWKQWIETKQNNLENQPSTSFIGHGCCTNKMKSDLLQLSADELNYSLSLFINETRKPYNRLYAPDTIYYFCLGIQYYLFKHNRFDNIFIDIYYEKFTDCLNEIAKRFSVLRNDSNYFVTRVVEEHLWECKQLGAHSPYALLNTLIYFNTKYFNLFTVEDHMQLSFSHIMKHWKRNHGKNSSTSSAVDSRNVVLCYYPPNHSKSKEKVYEQEENVEDAFRCPVTLYKFYLSKCPESVKTHVFYLAPERSCLPDSPVWYSTWALDAHAVEKMLNRAKMVHEINSAIFTD